MTGYIYNTHTMEVIVPIHGNSNAEIEAIAAELGYMHTDCYGLTYTPAFNAVDGLRG